MKGGETQILTAYLKERLYSRSLARSFRSDSDLGRTKVTLSFMNLQAAAQSVYLIWELTSLFFPHTVYAKEWLLLFLLLPSVHHTCLRRGKVSWYLGTKNTWVTSLNLQTQVRPQPGPWAQFKPRCSGSQHRCMPASCSRGIFHNVLYELIIAAF